MIFTLGPEENLGSQRLPQGSRVSLIVTQASERTCKTSFKRKIVIKIMMEKPHWINPSFSFTEVKTQAERGYGLAQNHIAIRSQQPQARGIVCTGFSETINSWSVPVFLCSAQRNCHSLQPHHHREFDLQTLIQKPSNPLHSGVRLAVVCESPAGLCSLLFTPSSGSVSFSKRSAPPPYSAIHLPRKHRFQFHAMGSR